MLYCTHLKWHFLLAFGSLNFSCSHVGDKDSWLLHLPLELAKILCKWNKTEQLFHLFASWTPLLDLLQAQHKKVASGENQEHSASSGEKI